MILYSTPGKLCTTTWAGFLLALSALVVCAPAGSAQTVRGTVQDSSTRMPVSGAAAALLDAAGRRLSAALSDDSGRFQLDIGAAVGTAVGARYTLRVDRIGYRSHVSDEFAIERGRDTIHVVTVVISPLPQPVATVNVTAARRCDVNPQDGAEVAALWEEVRSALNATVMTEQESQLRLRYQTYERMLDPRLRESGRETVDHLSRGTMAFQSTPADELAERGYVARVDGDLMYRGLDAHVLLSDSFLDSHCFAVDAPFGSYPRPADGRRRPRAQPTDSSLIGLTFSPVQRKSGFVDVSGVLWLDRETRKLVALEFGYNGLQLGVPTDELGGRMEFLQLGSGRWIVDSWWIRMPRIQRTGVAPFLGGSALPRYVLQGYLEVGGVVVEVEGAAGSRGAGG